MVSLSSNALCDTTFAFCWRELLNIWTQYCQYVVYLVGTQLDSVERCTPHKTWQRLLVLHGRPNWRGGEGGRDVPGRACHSVPTGGPQRFKIVVTLTHTVWLRPTKFGRTFDIRGVDCRMWDLCILWVLRYLTYAQTVWQRRNLARHGNTARDRFQR